MLRSAQPSQNIDIPDLAVLKDVRSSCICQIASFRLPHFLYSRERQLLITSVNVMIWYVLKTEDFYPWKIIFLYQD